MNGFSIICRMNRIRDSVIVVLVVVLIADHLCSSTNAAFHSSLPGRSVLTPLMSSKGVLCTLFV